MPTTHKFEPGPCQRSDCGEAIDHPIHYVFGQQEPGPTQHWNRFFTAIHSGSFTNCPSCYPPKDDSEDPLTT